MYKTQVRSFALGILFSASLIGAIYLFTSENHDTNLENAREYLENIDFIILSEEDYDALISETIENTDPKISSLHINVDSNTISQNE